MKCSLIAFISTTLLLVAPCWAQAQERVMEDCLQAFRVQLPLYSEAYALLPTDPAQNLPVLYYLPEDQYTFWYKIESTVTDTLRYRVWPTNGTDQFQAVLYQYSDTAFCRHLSNGRIAPEQVIGNPFSLTTDQYTIVGYEYTVAVAAGQQYFLSVLSLNADYCGHRLSLRFRDDQMDFHAMSKPCYDFRALDLDLTETDLESVEDTELDLMPDAPTPGEAEATQSTVLEPVIQPIPKKDAVVEQEISESEPEVVINDDDVEPGEIARSLNAGEKLDLQEVYFYNNTYAFREDSESQLNKLYQWLQKNPGVEIEIGGHTSGDTENIRPNPNFKSRGKAWNFKGSSEKLSKKRAEAVKDYLVEKGISPNRLKTKGYGDSEKIIENPRTPSDHRRNMRVEVAIIPE